MWEISTAVNKPIKPSPATDIGQVLRNSLSRSHGVAQTLAFAADEAALANQEDEPIGDFRPAARASPAGSTGHGTHRSTASRQHDRRDKMLAVLFSAI